METNFLTSRGVTFVIWISIELTFISFMLRPWRFTGKVFEVMYCVIIKQWISNDVCLFTSWNPTYPPPHDSLGLHNRRKQNAFSSSCFRHHLFSPLRHLRLISWSFLPSLPKVKMIPNVKKIPMREAPDLFIACNTCKAYSYQIPFWKNPFFPVFTNPEFVSWPGYRVTIVVCLSVVPRFIFIFYAIIAFLTLIIGLKYIEGIHFF